MMTHRIAPTVGLALLIAAGCMDAPQDEAAHAEEPLHVSTAGLQQAVRSSLDQFGAQMDRLDERYLSADDDRATTWSDTRSEVREFREELETDLARLEGASADGAERLKREMAEDLEQLTERLERAELEAVEGQREFLSASQNRMTELEEDLRALDDEAAALSEEAREEISDEVEELRERASELEIRLDELADATEDEIASRRSDIAQTFGALAASIQRELFELRQAVTD